MTGATGNTTTRGWVDPRGGILDIENSLGASNQFLSSAGNAVEWRDLIVGDLDMKNFAITNIGSGGSAFTGGEGLNLVDDLDLGGKVITNTGSNGLSFFPAGGLRLKSTLRIGPTGGSEFQVNGSNATLMIGPFGARKFVVNRITGTMAIGGDPGANTYKFRVLGTSGTLLIGPDSFSRKFSVSGLTGDLVIGPNLDSDITFLVVADTGDLHMDGAYFDSSDDPGNGGNPGSDLNDTVTISGGVTAAGGSATISSGGDIFCAGDFRAGPFGFRNAIINSTAATFNVPLNGLASFNWFNNLVTNQLQASAGTSLSPVLDVTGTADFSPLVRIFNFHEFALALQVDGDAAVTGMFSKGGGSFKIDHPLDPQNKYLYHSFVESPDMMNIYNGNVVTDQQDYAVVTMPEWFESLNRDFRYQLTVIDEMDSDSFVLAKVVREIEGNEFTVRTSQPNAKVSWQVTGIRHDPYAMAHRVPVDERMPAHERGTYLYAEAYGMPEELGRSFPRVQRMRETVAQHEALRQQAEVRVFGK